MPFCFAWGKRTQGSGSGVQCGRRGTSCADQLAKAVRRAYEAELNGEVQNFDED